MFPLETRLEEGNMLSTGIATTQTQWDDLDEARGVVLVAREDGKPQAVIE